MDDYLAAGEGTVRDLKELAEDRLRETGASVGTLLSEVEPERIEWLWPGRIPLGKLTVVDGAPAWARAR